MLEAGLSVRLRFRLLVRWLAGIRRVRPWAMPALRRMELMCFKAY